MGAAPIGEMYMNSREEVFVVRRREFFGPLIPQEIKELVIDNNDVAETKKRDIFFNKSWVICVNNSLLLYLCEW